MDTELLKTFIAVSKTRHFGKAAESLYLTQSAVSFRIRQLESQLGVVLFNRHRHNIQLTAAGERLVPYARTLLQTWQQARQEVTESPQQGQPLRLSAPACLWEAGLTDWLGRLSEQHPQQPLRTLISSSRSVSRQLAEQECDLAFSLDLPRSEEINALACGEIRLQLGTNLPSGVRLRPEQYCRIDWGSAFIQQQAVWFAPDHPPRLQSESLLQTLQHLHHQPGCAFIPDQLAASQLPAQWRLQADFPPQVFTLHALWPANSPHDARLRELLQTPVFPSLI
ncbi:HTH-type transcriptional regulator HdfR [Plesiomonas shigelloides]|uniref:HTH-type transcriptional regulator HdfR n=1 Tax=Plesiomonas shigelloides TaxID=703 RepID=UPI0032605D38